MDNIRKPYATLAAALCLGAFVMMPVASAEVIDVKGNTIGVCFAWTCVQTSTATTTAPITQTQTCGGSGNTIIQAGDNNTANVCNQNQTANNPHLDW